MSPSILCLNAWSPEGDALGKYWNLWDTRWLLLATADKGWASNSVLELADYCLHLVEISEAAATSSTHHRLNHFCNQDFSGIMDCFFWNWEPKPLLYTASHEYFVRVRKKNPQLKDPMLIEDISHCLRYKTYHWSSNSYAEFPEKRVYVKPYSLHLNNNRRTVLALEE